MVPALAVVPRLLKHSSKEKSPFREIFLLIFKDFCLRSSSILSIISEQRWYGKPKRKF